jgi:hypothetical protein
MACRTASSIGTMNRELPGELEVDHQTQITAEVDSQDFGAPSRAKDAPANQWIER